MVEFPYSVPALRVEQPLGIFYVAVLPAELLLEVAYSDVLSAIAREDGEGYRLDGTQRLPQPKRLKPIAEFIDRIDAAFPNSIILAANMRQADGLIEDEDLEVDVGVNARDVRWRVARSKNHDCYTLIIPTREKLAAIIDGQHRLFAFSQALPERLKMSLICSVFLDLPKPFQAQLFATINSTQKPVDKSLTYELFGYNLEEEAEEYWSPDKLAVYLSRRLGTESGSPLRGRILIAPKRDAILEELGVGANWKVSTAVVVEGIMRLFTSNPKKDSTLLLEGLRRKKRGEIAEERKDRSPMRKAYLNSEDVVIYKMVLNYVKACSTIFWERASAESFITRTVGVQALFDILRGMAARSYEDRDISAQYFMKKLSPASDIDFSSEVFRNASGSGRSMMRKAIESKLV